MKSKILYLTIGFMLLASACSPTPAQPANTTTEIVAQPATTQESAASGEPVTFRVLNWNGYGSDEPFALEEFGKMYNLKIEHDYINSEEELLTKLRTSPATYDVLLPNVAYLKIAMDEGLIEPIDVTKMENWDNLLPRFKNLSGLKDDAGNVYGVPWVWGATAVAYNTEDYPNGITSINALWDPENKGKVAVFDSFEDEMVFAGLALGDKTPYQPDDIEAVKAKLLDLMKNVKTLWSSEDEFNKLFANGDINLGNYWSGAASRAAKMGLPMAFVVPEEGALGWIDTWAIAKDAPNKEIAYKWLDYMISSQFYITWDTTSGAPAPTTQQSLDALPEDSFNRIVMGNPEMIDRLVFMESMSPQVREDWNRIWEEVKASQ
jgi:spermidine/putrescine transport system substrate-binding protein